MTRFSDYFKRQKQYPKTIRIIPEYCSVNGLADDLRPETQSMAVCPLQAAANSDLSDSIVSRTLVIFFDI